MDWLRRNWPDLIIGVALVAVIAGIVVTLLSGGSFLSLGGRGDVNRPLTSPSVSQTDALPPDAPNAGAQAGVQDGVQSGASNADSNTGSAADSAADNIVVVPPAADSEDAEATNTIVPVVPEGATPPDAAPSSGAQTGQNESTQSDNIPDIPVGEDGAVASNAVPALPPGVVASGGADGLVDEATQGGIYRVSVDAYASQENAERRAADLRGDGYPVFIGRQGDLYLVLVGPYESTESANGAAQRLRDSGLSADAYVVVYRPDETGAAGGLSSSGATESGATESGTTDTSGAVTTAGSQDAVTLSADPNPLQNSDLVADASSAEGNPGAASANGANSRYLQVGAFVTSSSAAPRLTRLESLGYSVTQANDNNVIKLFVGPFAPAELPAAQARLDAQGIENFPISQ